MQNRLSERVPRSQQRQRKMKRRLIVVLAAVPVFLIAGNLSLRLIPIPPALLRPPVQSIALLDRNGIPLREARVAERFSRELTPGEKCRGT